MKDISKDDLEKKLKRSSKKAQDHKTTVAVGRESTGYHTIGKDIFTVIAGPCAVESKEQILEIAENVKKRGAHMLRGGAYKPITFPGAYQALEEKGLEYLREAGDKYKIPVVTEVLYAKSAALVAEYSDMIQIGARNMQNFELLIEAGKTKKPILLKRHPGMSLRDLLGAAEWLLAQDNPNVVLCERGVSAPHTHNQNARFLLDLHAVPALNEYTHLPVIVDPSHGTFRREYVPPLARGAVAVGADGVIMDVHYDPPNAHVDPLQALDYKAFENLMEEMDGIARVIGKKVYPDKLTMNKFLADIPK